MRHNFMLYAAMIRAIALSGASAGCRTTGGGDPPVYRIRIESGDTLASLATKYETTWEKIARLNGMSVGKALKIGAVVRVIPGPGGYVAADDVKMAAPSKGSTRSTG